MFSFSLTACCAAGFFFGLVDLWCYITLWCSSRCILVRLHSDLADLRGGGVRRCFCGGVCRNRRCFWDYHSFLYRGWNIYGWRGFGEVIRQREEARRREVEEREGKERWDKIRHKKKSSKQKESQEIKKRRYWNFANHFLSQLCLLDLETGAWLTEVKYHCNLNSHLAGIYFSHGAVCMHRFSD